MTHEVTREDLLERVQQLAPVIREHADRAEQERHLADPVVAAIQEAGLYRMLIPRALGGLQVDPLTLYQVVEALARVDGSTGWCMFINGSAPLSIGFLQDEAAETMCGKEARMIQSATIFPFGRAVPHKGGYLVSGHWVYASGCWYSTWHMVACNVYEDRATEPRSDPAGMPELIMAHLPGVRCRSSTPGMLVGFPPLAAMMSKCRKSLCPKPLCGNSCLRLRTDDISGTHSIASLLLLLCQSWSLGE